MWLNPCITHPSKWLMVSGPEPAEVFEQRTGQASYGELPFVAPARKNVRRYVSLRGWPHYYIQQDIMKAIFGAVQGAWETSKPESGISA